MKFLQMLSGQELILCRIETKRAAIKPVVAKSAGRTEPILLTFILWLCVQMRPVIHYRPSLSAGKMAILIVLATVLVNVLLEQLAAGYIQKAIGV